MTQKPTDIWRSVDYERVQRLTKRNTPAVKTSRVVSTRKAGVSEVCKMCLHPAINRPSGVVQSADQSNSLEWGCSE